MQAGFSADSDAFRELWKAKPFHGARIHFAGFPESERTHMVQELLRNGGRECADYRSDPCTHVVVDNNAVQTMPKDVSNYSVKIQQPWKKLPGEASRVVAVAAATTRPETHFVSSVHKLTIYDKFIKHTTAIYVERKSMLTHMAVTNIL